MSFYDVIILRASTWSNVTTSFFIYSGCTETFQRFWWGKNQDFMIIRWPISWFVYQWHHFTSSFYGPARHDVIILWIKSLSTSLTLYRDYNISVTWLDVMVRSHCPTPRPIKNGLHRIVWRCSGSVSAPLVVVNQIIHSYYSDVTTIYTCQTGLPDLHYALLIRKQGNSQ